jgi:hypothetical protein
MVSDGSPDIAARHSLLLVWRWLEAMGRRGMRCGVVRAHLYLRDGPVRAEIPTMGPNDRQLVHIRFFIGV